MSDSRNLERRLLQLFAERLSVEVPSVEIDLIETGLLDSLTLVELLAQLEEAFSIQLSLADLEIDHFRTISRIARFLATKTLRPPLARAQD